MTKEEKKIYNRNYGFLQLPRDEYELLKQFCKENSMIMGRYVSDLIKKDIQKKTKLIK